MHIHDISHLWGRLGVVRKIFRSRANSLIRGKFELSSYVNIGQVYICDTVKWKLALRDLWKFPKTGFNEALFIKTWEKGPLCGIRKRRRSNISGQVSTPAMVFGCSVSFSLMISCFRMASSFSIGTYIRKRTENYTFIDAQIPNCTINGHSSSIGKTSKSPRAFSIYKKFQKIFIGNFCLGRARSICHQFHSREPRDGWPFKRPQKPLYWSGDKNNRHEKFVNGTQSFHRENGTTFSEIPFFPENFQWNDLKSRVPFTSQPEFPKFFGQMKTDPSRRRFAPIILVPASPQHSILFSNVYLKGYLSNES